MLSLWYIKMLSAHLLTDFVLQPDTWVKGRLDYHWKSKHIYFHVILTAFTASLFTGFGSWTVFLTILLSHYLIDLWKSYRPATLIYFFTDQLLHLLVIGILGAGLFRNNLAELTDFFASMNNRTVWICAMAILFLSYPSGIIIGMLTARWRNQIVNPEPTLGNAGKWIGILERLIIFVLVVFDQYAAIGLLTAAKSILRFSEGKDAHRRTEYVLIGTLISIAVAICAGLLVKTAIK